MTRYGIDVSHHQGAIDWTKVKLSKLKALDGTVHPLEFAFIRAGICHNGCSYKADEQFTRNMTQAAKQGIPVGVYLYSYITTVEGIVGAADALLSALKPYGKIPVAFDLEDQEIYAKLSKTKIMEIAKAFLNRIKAAGHPVLLYTYTAFAQSYLDLKAFDCPKWIADYRGCCGIKEPDIWQYSSKGSIQGIAGNVDLNVSYTDKCPLMKGEETMQMVGKLYIGDFTSRVEANMAASFTTRGGHACEVVPYNGKWGVLVTELAKSKTVAQLKTALVDWAGIFSCDPSEKK